MGKSNIVLIGMPGAGKSTVGVVLAKVLAWDFIDADLIIQKRTGKKLSELIETYGIDKFIEIEGDINSKITGNKQIIATGGSVVYSEKAMEALSKLGTILYVKLDYKDILSRLGNLKNRGVVLKKKQNLYDLYLERTPLYEKYSDISVKIPSDSSISNSVALIINALKEHNIEI